jgi:putative flippase GtrA
LLKIDKPFLLKFIRFCIVGAISFVINAGFTYLFSDLLTLDLWVATIIALLLTQLFQFPMSKDWAFRYRNRAKIIQFLFFLGARFGSLIIIWIFTNYGPSLFPINLPLVPAWVPWQLAGVFVGMIFNFFIADRYIFAQSGKEISENRTASAPVQADQVKN